MQNDDQYLERTPDLVAKVRAMRQAAEKEMNRFTRLADYDVRRVVGHGPKPTQPPAPPNEKPKRSATKSAPAQSTLTFAPAPAERDDRSEGA